MSGPSVIFSVLLLGSGGFLVSCGWARIIEARGTRMHSRSHYYGWWTFLIVVIPSLVFFIFWSICTNLYLENKASSSCHTTAGDMAQSCSVLVKMAHDLAHKLVLDDHFRNSQEDHDAVLQNILGKRKILFSLDNKEHIVSIAIEWAQRIKKFHMIGTIITFVLAILSCFVGIFSVSPERRSRNRVECVTVFWLMLASSIVILITVGIVLSMLFQTISFFQSVSLANFFFGTVWDPRFSAVDSEEVVGQFGLIPLLAGTLYIAFIAMLFAIPVGLFSAIYLAEYTVPWLRGIIKPLLEILAGIPTIVYGFFALAVLGPFLHDLSIFLASGHAFIMAQSALTAGLVMGIMLVPFVSSLSDDIITAVPRSLRDGSFGLGATQSETIWRVILPAAFPGIVASLLLTASRAIGETMIVVLAAGVVARLTINPFEAMTTITVKIVNQLTGDFEFNSPQTLVAFALGMTLLVLTLLMNIVALYVVRKYREQYE